MSNVCIDIKALNCLEPMHREFASQEIIMTVRSMEIYFSDWVMQVVNSFMKVKQRLEEQMPKK